MMLCIPGFEKRRQPSLAIVHGASFKIQSGRALIQGFIAVVIVLVNHHRLIHTLIIITATFNNLDDLTHRGI